MTYNPKLRRVKYIKTKSKGAITIAKEYAYTISLRLLLGLIPQNDLTNPVDMVSYSLKDRPLTKDILDSIPFDLWRYIDITPEVQRRVADECIGVMNAVEFYNKRMRKDLKLKTPKA
jgi:hypothetical protein